MKKLILVLISIFIFYIVQTNNAGIVKAVELDKCNICHEKTQPIPTITKNCLVCHLSHSRPESVANPRSRDPAKVHEIHIAPGKKVGPPECKQCHKEPTLCTDCHNSHPNEATNASYANCINCHGPLPNPKGHTDFREALLDSKHSWTQGNCATCHGKNFTLHFKDLKNLNIDNSNNLCKICHSYQYNQYSGLTPGSHGTQDKKCVDCHNPHTTTSKGLKFESRQPEEKNTDSASELLNLTINTVTTKVPVLKNPLIMLIIGAVILATIFEYTLSRHEKGTKVVSSLVRVQDNEAFMKTLEIELSNQKISDITDLLESHSIKVLGMTMNKASKDAATIYKYILFINVGGSDIAKNELQNLINQSEGVISVQFTAKYEL